jgi:hypothetical protein
MKSRPCHYTMPGLHVTTSFFFPSSVDLIHSLPLNRSIFAAEGDHKQSANVVRNTVYTSTVRNMAAVSNSDVM